MAEASNSEEIVTPSNRTAAVWKHFGFRKDSHGNLMKSDRAVCKICHKSVSHGGGTTNLRNHLKAVHSTVYYELFPTPSSSTVGEGMTQGTVDRYLVHTNKLTSNSQRYKALVEACADFITKDMRPVSVVDGIGFLKLMQIAEPRFTVPCRKTIMKMIDEKYRILKHSIHGEIAQQRNISLTTDMWTSRRGNGYISLTCHFLTSQFDMVHRNLTTCFLPGVHDHQHIAAALRDFCTEWCIDIDRQVAAFTTDNGSNIVKTLDEDLEKIRIPCAGHTLNLSVRAALSVQGVVTAVSRCRKVVSHFNHSRLDREELALKQKQLVLPQHSLVKDVETRWNSTYDMIKRMCEQQAAVAAVLITRRALSHLELSSTEWRILEDIAVVLEPFKDATVYLSADTYPTISVLGPLFSQMKQATAIADADSTVIRDFKLALSKDMENRYRDPFVLAYLSKASFLDPRFKSLAHLSPLTQRETIDSIQEELIESLESTTSTCISECDADSISQGSITKKQKLNLLEKMLGDQFDTNMATGEASTVSGSDIIHGEISRYKSEPSLKLTEKPLQWWKVHRHSFPNISLIAQKYLGTVATSTASERLFSISGCIISSKRAALSPENVNKLVFMHKNSPPTHLDYKRLRSKCHCEECETINIE